MRNCMVVVCLLVVGVTLSAAQGKIESQWSCGKPGDMHSVAVADHEGHAYAVAQGKCTSEKGSMGDVKEQEGSYSEFGDATSSSNENRGIFVVTMANGDKVYYHYHGTQTMKNGNMETGTNKWTITGGTGKFKGVKGEGGCKGKGGADGASSWTCEGTYSMAK